MPLNITGTAKTAFVAKTRNTASSTTTSNGVYVDATNIASIASVPLNHVCALVGYAQKSTAGTGSVRITDGTNTIADRTGIGTSSTNFLIQGNCPTNNATVKVQIKSDSDTNTFTLQSGGTTASQLLVARFILMPMAGGTIYTMSLIASVTTLVWNFASVTESSAGIAFVGGSTTSIQTTSTTNQTVPFNTSITFVTYGQSSLPGPNHILGFDITGTLVTYT